MVCPAAHARTSRAVCRLCPNNTDIPATITDLTIAPGGCPGPSYPRPNVFSRYTNLESLNLDNTNVRSLVGAVFEQNVNLRTLSLANNPITGYSSTLFNGLTKLKELNLAHISIGGLVDAWFSPLTSLEILNLDGNFLVMLKNNSVDGLVSLVELSIDNNPVATIEVDAFKPLTSVQEISMKRTDLVAFPPLLFAGLSSLLVVDASDGKIQFVAENSLIGTRLVRPNLSGNMLTTVPHAAIQNADMPPQDVDLSFNRISRIFETDFQNVSTSTLKLRCNPITVIEDGAFSGSNITHLDLSDTSLGSLPISMEAWMTTQNVTISLEGLAWLCGCGQLWLGRYLERSPASRGPTCGPDPIFSCKTLVSIVPQLEADCKTTPTMTNSTNTSMTNTSSPTTSKLGHITQTTTVTRSPSRKPTLLTSPTAVPRPSTATMKIQRPRPSGPSPTPSGQSPSSRPNRQTKPGNTMTTNINAGWNPSPSTTSNGNPHTSISSNGARSPNTARPQRTTTSPAARSFPKPGSGANSHSDISGNYTRVMEMLVGCGMSDTTENRMLLLLTVLCTLVACLLCVGVVTACLYWHRRGRDRRGQVSPAD